jgi:hypothetical protein
MLRHIHSGIAFFASTASITFGGLDLTPCYKAIELGEAVIHRVHFRDGDKQFAVTINSDTEIFGGENHAAFRFKSISLAEMSLRQSTIKPSVPFSTENLPNYKSVARQQLGATAVIVAEAEPEFDVLPINGWKSCRFNFTTKQPGLVFKTEVTFLNLNSEQQIIIVTTSKEADFPEVQARARKIMSRWHEVLPGDEAGLN